MARGTALATNAAVPTIVSPKKITTLVPTGATTGALVIDTPYGSASQSFTVI